MFRFILFPAILLLASAMLYGQKVNYDEAKYTNGEWNRVVKRQLDMSIPQRYVLNNLFNKFKNFMDSLPTKTPLQVAIGGATQPEDVSLPPDVTSRYESRDDVFYRAEVGYCYHLGIFGAVLGFVSCGFSLYQSWRDSNLSSGIQRLWILHCVANVTNAAICICDPKFCIQISSEKLKQTWVNSNLV